MSALLEILVIMKMMSKIMIHILKTYEKSVLIKMKSFSFPKNIFQVISKL